MDAARRKDTYMDFRQLYYFVRLCEEMNYSAAASKLFLTPQALSKSIKSLETELGTPLFIRSSSGVQLTAYGKAVYPICQEIVHNFTSGIQKIRSISPDGIAPIRLVTSYQACEALSFTLLEDFLQQHPQSQILSEAMADIPAEESVLDGSADFVLSIGIPQKEELFRYDLIRPFPLCVMMGPEHPLYHKEALAMQDLDGLTLYCAGAQFKTYHLLQRLARESAVSLKLLPVSGYLYETYKNVFAINQAIIGVYNEEIDLGFPNIRQVRFEDPLLNWDIYFCCRKDYVLNETEQQFYQYILGFQK